MSKAHCNSELPDGLWLAGFSCQFCKEKYFTKQPKAACLDGKEEFYFCSEDEKQAWLTTYFGGTYHLNIAVTNFENNLAKAWVEGLKKAGFTK